MPAIHETYSCRVCEKTHLLFLEHGTAPDLSQQLYFTCPSSGFAVRITRAEGWKPADAKPQSALAVLGCGKDFSNRAGS